MNKNKTERVENFDVQDFQYPNAVQTKALVVIEDKKFATHIKQKIIIHNCHLIVSRTMKSIAPKKANKAGTLQI